MGHWIFEFFVSRRDAEVRRDRRGVAMHVDKISAIVVDECIAIHRELGPGLFEIVYESILAGRLEARGLRVARQVAVPLVFDGQSFEAAFRIDILVEDTLVLEIKAVETIEQSACEAIAYLFENIETARRAASEFFRCNDEGGNSQIGQRPQARLNLCGLCEPRRLCVKQKKTDKVMETRAGDPGAFARFDLNRVPTPAFCRGRSRSTAESCHSCRRQSAVRGEGVVGAKGFFDVVARRCCRRISRWCVHQRPVGSAVGAESLQGRDCDLLRRL